MGWVNAPPTAVPGQLLVEGELDSVEIAEVTSKLIRVLQLVQQPSTTGASSALAARLAAVRLSPAGADGTSPQHTQQQQHPAPTQHVPVAASMPAVAPAAVAAPAATTSAAPPRAAELPPASMPAVAARAAAAPAPVAALPLTRPVALSQPTQQSSLSAPPQPRPPPPAPRTIAPPAPVREPEPVVPTGPAWRQCFASDPTDHASSAVSALAYVPELPGLPGGDGHMGWLISSGRNLINLFECNAGGGAKGEPSLMLMHSQELDFVCTRLEVETPLNSLFAISLAADSSECVTVHSLDAELLLSYRYRFAPPQQRGGSGARLINHIASLHAVGGALARCCAVSYGGRVVVFEAPDSPPPTGTTITRTRSNWDAHPGATISALHLAARSPTLYSAANDGVIAAWDVRARPTSPVATLLGHTRNVTSVQLVHDSCLASCGIDSRVLLWDPRRPESPYATVNPDGAPCLRLAPSPYGDCIAVNTNRGLHAVDLIDGSHTVTPIAPFPLPRPFLDITWNSGTGEVYASGHNGSITVFTRT